MGKRTVIPFGPQHPVLPEPIHLDLVMEDERVVEAIPSVGYVHRGLEKLVEKRSYIDYVYVAERICGICSFIHGLGYCQAVEAIMGLEVPDRAKFLRTFWAELSRLHSHTLWLGLLADAFGFESLFMHSWRIREQILDIFEETTGGRVIFSVCKVGGVRRDIDADMMKRYLDKFNTLEQELRSIAKVFLDDNSVKHRLQGVGVLTREDAYDLGAVGPMLRASGVASDTRKLGYAAYKYLNIEPIVHTSGDCYGRNYVRINELFQSIDIIRQVVDLMPEGELEIKPKGNPKGEYFARLEQPRGEVIYYVKANGTQFLDRVRVRTPTYANLPALVKTLQGCELADVPMLVLTIDPCISCTER